MKRKTVWAAAGLTLLVLLVLFVGVMGLRHPLPARAEKQTAPECEPEWWHDPPRLTADEVAAQQWLADITYRLPAEKEAEYWDVGGASTEISPFGIRRRFRDMPLPRSACARLPMWV